MINIEKMLAFDEGKRLTAYRCTQGKLTVGIGHNLITKPAALILKRVVRYGEKISEDECSALFAADLQSVRHDINAQMPYFESLDERYQAVIFNMVFQMGIAGVLKFKNTLHAMQNDDVNQVVYGIKNSLYYQQTPERAQRMIRLVRGEHIADYE